MSFFREPQQKKFVSNNFLSIQTEIYDDQGAHLKVKTVKKNSNIFAFSQNNFVKKICFSENRVKFDALRKKMKKKKIFPVVFF